MKKKALLVFMVMCAAACLMVWSAYCAEPAAPAGGGHGPVAAGQVAHMQMGQSVLSGAVAAVNSSSVAEGKVDIKQMNKLKRGDEGFWGYALVTLFIRFVGIFVVLAILQVIMQMSGRLFISLERKKSQAK